MTLFIKKPTAQLFVLIWLALTSFYLPVCAQTSSPPYYDVRDYYTKLAAARSDILFDKNGHPLDTDEALNALEIRRAFHPMMLTKNISYSDVANKYCSQGGSHWVADRNWVSLQQSSDSYLDTYLQGLYNNSHSNGQTYPAWLAPQNNIKPTSNPNCFDYYPPDQWVAFFVGPTKNFSFYDPRGIDCKIYLTFKNPFTAMSFPTTNITNLQTNRFFNFAIALIEQNFNGDFKAYSTIPDVFMHYNQLVCHAVTVENAKLAEQVARKYFVNPDGSSQIEYMARGIDTESSDGTILDWHQYVLLHKGKINALPPDIQAFLRYDGWPN